MNLKIRLEKLEIAKNQEPGGYWVYPVEYFYGDTDAVPVWMDRILTIDDFYRQGLPGINEIYEILPESRQPTD